jgi:transposase InsO family protein
MCEEPKLTYLSSDRGTEFFNSEMREFLQQHGIKHQSGPPYTPEYNAVQKRRNRTLVEMALAMLFQADLPMHCWGLAVDTANYIRNRCPCASNPDNLTPYEMVFGQPPDLRHLRVFGSRCFYHVPSEQRNKLQPKALEGIFVGYDVLSRCYRILPKGRFQPDNFVQGCNL